MNTTDTPANPGQAYQLGGLTADGVWKAQLPKVHADLVLANIANRRRFTAEVVALITRLAIELAVLLELIRTIDLLAVPKFVAREVFITENQPDGIRFWLSEEFKRLFLTKVETDVPATTLRVHRLTKDSVDGPIIKAIGDKVYQV